MVCVGTHASLGGMGACLSGAQVGVPPPPPIDVELPPALSRYCITKKLGGLCVSSVQQRPALLDEKQFSIWHQCAADMRSSCLDS